MHQDSADRQIECWALQSETPGFMLPTLARMRADATALELLDAPVPHILVHRIL
jgi:hypothetical protein